MVFFNCNKCGNALKKNQVEKHLYSCSTQSVSCIDCGKDFFGNDYNQHIRCISEDEKYGGDNFKYKENAFKGKKKQEEWVQKVKQTVSNSSVSPRVKMIIQKLTEYDNIPRKKQKFINFAKSTLKVYNNHDIDSIWTLFSEASTNETKNNDNLVHYIILDLKQK